MELSVRYAVRREANELAQRQKEKDATVKMLMSPAKSDFNRERKVTVEEYATWMQNGRKQVVQKAYDARTRRK